MLGRIKLETGEVFETEVVRHCTTELIAQLPEHLTGKIVTCNLYVCECVFEHLRLSKAVIRVVADPPVTSLFHLRKQG